MAHASHSAGLKRLTKSFYFLAALLLAAIGAPAVTAQAPCEHVIFHLADTAQTVDREAICRAAEPWAEQGVQTVVLLTDFLPGGQEEWYDYLDRAEAEMNVRDLSQEDAFNVNVLALEASTAANQYVYNITIGEALFDTLLDSEAGRAPVIGALREGVVGGEPTAAFANALSAAYALNYPTVAAPSTETAVEESVDGFNLMSLLPILLLFLALAAGAYYFYPRLLEPALAERRQRSQPVTPPLWPRRAESDSPALQGSGPMMTQAELLGSIDALLAGVDRGAESAVLEEE